MGKNYTLWLYLLVGLLAACQKTEPNANQPLLIQQARVVDDPATSINIDQQTHTITVSPSVFQTGRMRSNLLNLQIETSANAALAPLNPNQTVPVNQQVSFEVSSYDNSQPISLRVRSINAAQSMYQDYQLQLKAAGPVRFESLPASQNKQVISLKYYQTYLVNLPISNLYDGHPQDYRIYAKLAGSTEPIELSVGDNRYSLDYVQFYFDQQRTKPGRYSIELRKADGQRIVSPTQIIVDNS